MTIRVVLLAVLAVTLSGAPAPAQPVSPGSACTGQAGVGWDQQIESCTAIIEFPQESSRNRAVAYNNRGNAWKAKGDYRPRHRRLRRGDPARSEIRRRLQQPRPRLDRQGRLRPRHRRLQRGDPARPEICRAYNNRGLAWYAQGRLRPRHRRLQRGDPARSEIPPTPTTTAASPSAARSDYDRAIADYDRGDPARSEIRRRLHQPRHRLARKGDYDRAIADFNEAIRLDPKDADAYYNRGTAYADKGDYDRAIADFSEAIRLDPKHAAAYFQPRQCLVRQGRLRPRHRRLQRGDPARSEIRRRLLSTAASPSAQGRLRPRHRRLRRGDPARSE